MMDIDEPPDEPLQVDELDDNDSSYGGGDDESQTTSLKSSITTYVYENGRRYHSYRQGLYWYGSFSLGAWLSAYAAGGAAGRPPALASLEGHVAPGATNHPLEGSSSEARTGILGSAPPIRQPWR